jgi:hypothetical protein
MASQHQQAPRARAHALMDLVVARGGWRQPPRSGAATGSRKGEKVPRDVGPLSTGTVQEQRSGDATRTCAAVHMLLHG